MGTNTMSPGITGSIPGWNLWAHAFCVAMWHCFVILAWWHLEGRDPSVNHYSFIRKMGIITTLLMCWVNVIGHVTICGMILWTVTISHYSKSSVPTDSENTEQRARYLKLSVFFVMKEKALISSRCKRFTCFYTMCHFWKRIRDWKY